MARIKRQRQNDTDEIQGGLFRLDQEDIRNMLLWVKDDKRAALKSMLKASSVKQEGKDAYVSCSRPQLSQFRSLDLPLELLAYIFSMLSTAMKGECVV